MLYNLRSISYILVVHKLICSHDWYTLNGVLNKCNVKKFNFWSGSINKCMCSMNMKMSGT